MPRVSCRPAQPSDHDGIRPPSTALGRASQKWNLRRAVSATARRLRCSTPSYSRWARAHGSTAVVTIRTSCGAVRGRSSGRRRSSRRCSAGLHVRHRCHAPACFTVRSSRRQRESISNVYIAAAPTSPIRGSGLTRVVSAREVKLRTAQEIVLVELHERRSFWFSRPNASVAPRVRRAAGRACG